MRLARGVIAALVAMSGSAVSVDAQSPLTLDEALATARDGAYTIRMAEGEARERSAGRLRALQGILPTVRLESSFMRTTDPVAAFGVNLRQRTISQADFAPDRLNYPPVREDWTGAVVLEVPLLNPDAWLGLSAAGSATEAAEAAADWRSYETSGDVVRAYFGGILAAEMVETLEAALEAARSHVRQAELMVEQGLVTPSDALLARVKAGEVEVQLVSARGEARSAVRQLATLLGAPDRLPILPETLPSAEAVRQVVASARLEERMPADMSDRLAGREDVRAARLGLSAARRDVLRARSTWLPRINAFGRYDWHSPDRLFEGDENWTVGVMAQWTPIAGASHLAESMAAAGRRATAEARADAALANAQLEAATASDRLEAALERLRIAERAVDYAAEAHRIVGHKYEGGLATVVELLDASATETRARLERAQAVFTVIDEAAARTLALGANPALFAVLDDYAHRNRSE